MSFSFRQLNAAFSTASDSLFFSGSPFQAQQLVELHASLRQRDDSFYVRSRQSPPLEVVCHPQFHTVFQKVICQFLTPDQSLWQFSLPGKFAVESHLLTCQQRAAETSFASFIRKNVTVIFFFANTSTANFPSRSVAVVTTGIACKNVCSQTGKFICPAKMSRQQGYHKFAQFIYYQHSRVFLFCFV